MRINVLGPWQVAVSGGLPEIKGAKRYALLAALLLDPGRTVSRERLVDAVWEDDPPTSALANLRTYVADLRRALGPLADGRPRLASSASGYAIEVGPEELDLLCFEKLSGEGLAACRRGDHAAAVSFLARAVGLWRGHAFDGVELGSWARARVTALEDRRWEAQLALADARLALGRHEDVVAGLRDVVAERPLSERAWALLMTALTAVGRRSEALDAFARARAVLDRELGVRPGPELRAAHERALAADRPAVRSADHRAGPCALPAPVSDFVGRQGLLAGLGGWLTGHDGPLVAALSGPPGVGKTALALRAAHLLRPSFADGQLYQALGASTGRQRPPGEVLAEFLRTLGVRELPDGVEDRAALFRSTVAHRRLLVVLDDAADVAQVRPLLPGTGSCRAVITSRHRLTALEGAHAVTVAPLTETEGIGLLAAVAGPARIRRERDAATRIFLACGGHPLALRVAAVRLAMRPAWPLATLADRLWDEPHRLDELTIGELSVRAYLESSFRRLADGARRAVALLARHVGDDVPAGRVAEVLGRPEAESDRIVEELMCANLLVPTGGAEPSYRLDRLFRLYALYAR
ncbi:DNA-binding SARP family transcriptional activator [Actinophytocola oryzae]|uniref:DNA-binding SARP family transcriptional activator n=2 Tax=Actinophytocola oryzae TaxID=502181 RepID=A0A4R7W161_9PSEU|nr:DNA-binding SARP family transcriptional activator [Actinophytocola oryzae]